MSKKSLKQKQKRKKKLTNRNLKVHGLLIAEFGSKWSTISNIKIKACQTSRIPAQTIQKWVYEKKEVLRWSAAETIVGKIEEKKVWGRI